MSSWIIRWKFNKESYSPKESVSIDFWLENTGETYLYLSGLEINFDFGPYSLKNISGAIPPRTNKSLGNVSLLLRENIVGRKVFTLKYRIHESINNNSWVDLGYYPSDRQYFINIYPTPFYNVFISRGLRTEDKIIGDPISEMIREWGFKTVTVGVEIEVPEEQVAQAIKEEMKKADALIAIATPRFMDAFTGLLKTLEWLHGEVGIAFGIDKPLLILKDNKVSLLGLPAYLKDKPIIEFDSYNLEELRAKLPTIMFEFRGWIETKRKKEFYDTLGKVIVGGLAVVGGIAIISGIIGSLTGTSKR